MIETSTPASRNLCEKAKSDGICASEDMTEEEQSFYDRIRPGLNMIVREPLVHTVENILNYSRLKK